MTKTVVVYHSGYGHTQRVAQFVAEGAKAQQIAIDADGNITDADWEALDAAEEKGSFTRLEQLVAALQNPYDLALVDTIYAKAPEASAAPYVTYCGT